MKIRQRVFLRFVNGTRARLTENSEASPRQRAPIVPNINFGVIPQSHCTRSRYAIPPASIFNAKLQVSWVPLATPSTCLRNRFTFGPLISTTTTIQSVRNRCFTDCHLMAQRQARSRYQADPLINSLFSKVQITISMC